MPTSASFIMLTSFPPSPIASDTIFGFSHFANLMTSAFCFGDDLQTNTTFECLIILPKSFLFSFLSIMFSQSPSIIISKLISATSEGLIRLGLKEVFRELFNTICLMNNLFSEICNFLFGLLKSEVTV